MRKQNKNKKSKAVVKPTNPKCAIGIKKVSMSCLSSQSVALVAQAMVVEQVRLQEIDVYVVEQINAALAHLMSFWEGFDDEWKIPHLARAMARIIILRAAELDGTLEDDRKITDDEGVHIAGLNSKAANIIEKLPDCVDPFTEKPVGTLGFKVVIKLDTCTPFDVLPWRVVLEMALGMMEGGRKYGRHNYRAIGVRASVYYDATMRHLVDYLAGKNIDHESGLSHLTKALSSSQVLLDSMIMGNWVDDRPLRIE